MSTAYRNLLNTYDVSEIDSIVVTGNVDFSDATLVGFPVDNLTIRVNDDGQIEVLDGGITIAKVFGTDLWTRLLSDEANIATVLSRTQYQSSGGNVTSFTGTISVPAITLNAIDLNTRLTADETDIVTLLTRTQRQSVESLNSDIKTVFASEVIPVGNETIDLGYFNPPTARRWKTFYGQNVDLTGFANIAGNLLVQSFVDSNLIPKVTNAFDLGTNLLKWRTLYVVSLSLNGTDLNTRLTTDETNIATLQTKTQFFSVSNIGPINYTNVSSNFQPSLNATYYLGDVGRVWAQIHGSLLGINTISTSSGSGNITLNTSIIPAFSTVDLGETLNPFRAVYTMSLNLNGVDLNSRISALETKTQYQTAAGSVTTWTSNLDPNADNTYDLGNPALEWRRLYAHTVIIDGAELDTVDGGKLSSNTSFVPQTDNALDLGSSTTTFRWRSLFVATSLNVGATSTLSIFDGGRLALNNSFIPRTTSTYELGNGNFLWGGVSAVTLYASTNLNIGTNTISLLDTGKFALNNSLIPSTDNTRDLGSSTTTFRWRSLFTSTSLNIGTNTISLLDTGKFALNNSLIPSTDNARDLGSSTSTFRWRSLFVGTSLNVGTTSTLSLFDGGRLALNNSFIPITTNTYQLGNANYLWSNVSATSWTGTTWNNLGTAYSVTLTATGFKVLGGSTTEKPTGTLWTNPSDKRLKKNIRRDKVPGLKEINQLSVCSYEFNENSGFQDGKPHLGFIADEVEAVFPNAVIPVENQNLGVVRGLDCSDLFYALFPAIQELSKKLDVAMARISYLEEQLGQEPSSKRQAF